MYRAEYVDAWGSTWFGNALCWPDLLKQIRAQHCGLSGSICVWVERW